MTDTNTPGTIEFKVLSMSEKSKDHITADLMCSVALNTKLHLFTSTEFEACPKPKEPGIYIVPIQDEDVPVRLVMLEVTKAGSRIRDTEISTAAGWSVKHRWLFKHYCDA